MPALWLPSPSLLWCPSPPGRPAPAGPGRAGQEPGEQLESWARARARGKTSSRVVPAAAALPGGRMEVATDHQGSYSLGPFPRDLAYTVTTEKLNPASWRTCW